MSLARCSLLTLFTVQALSDAFAIGFDSEHASTRLQTVEHIGKLLRKVAFNTSRLRILPLQYSHRCLKSRREYWQR